MSFHDEIAALIDDAKACNQRMLEVMTGREFGLDQRAETRASVLERMLRSIDAGNVTQETIAADTCATYALTASRIKKARRDGLVIETTGGHRFLQYALTDEGRAWLDGRAAGQGEWGAE